MTGHEAPSSEPARRPGESICEPDADTLAEWYRLYGENSGKFIRIRDIVFIAPGFPDPLSGEQLRHDDLFMGAFWNTEEALQAKVRDAIESSSDERALDPEGYLADAGRYDFEVDGEGAVTAFEIFGDSRDYGRADEAGRQKTGNLVQKNLGDITVSVADY